MQISTPLLSDKIADLLAAVNLIISLSDIVALVGHCFNNALLRDLFLPLSPTGLDAVRKRERKKMMRGGNYCIGKVIGVMDLCFYGNGCKRLDWTKMGLKSVLI